MFLKHEDNGRMISNFRVAVKMHKHVSEETGTRHGVVEFEKPEAAELAVSSAVHLKDNLLEKELAKGRELKDGGRGGGKYRSKVHVGNLSPDATEDMFADIFRSEIQPVSVFLARSADKDRKYAFLEFKDEAERNVALGTLEEMKKSGGFSPEVTISPAYPSFQFGRRKRFPSKAPGKRDD